MEVIMEQDEAREVSYIKNVLGKESEWIQEDDTGGCCCSLSKKMKGQQH